MKVEPLSKQLQALLGADLQVTITHEDLTETSAATAQDITIFTAADGDLVAVVGSALVTPFEDASDSAFNTTALTVGDSSDTDRLLASQELNANGTEIDYAAGALAGYAYNASTAILANFGSMAAKSLSNIDTGELVLFVKLVSLADIVAEA